MGPDKWVDVEKRVSKEDAISMFNFKEGPKQYYGIGKGRTYQKAGAL